MEKLENVCRNSKGDYIMVAMNTKTRKVVRVTAEEFELDNEDIYPHVIEFDEDEVLTVEEFQGKCY